MSTSIRDFTRELVEKWCLGQPAYINYEVMRKDIRTVLRTFDAEHAEKLQDDASYLDEDDIRIVSHDVQAILVVLKPDYVGDDRCLDMRVEEMDLEIQGLVCEFFERRYNRKHLTQDAADEEEEFAKLTKKAAKKVAKKVAKKAAAKKSNA